MSRQRWWLLAERLQATLPLLAAAGVAAFTWWLVQSSPREDGPSAPALASSAPDYELDKARVLRFDPQGRLTAILDGTAMRHYPDPDRLVIDQLQLSARDDTGQGLQAIAREGEADQNTEIVNLRGGVKVTAVPPAPTPSSPKPKGGPVHFEGEGLRIDTRQRIVSSELPVLLTQDHSRIEAQSIVYNDGTRIADLGGRVRGHYTAPGAGAKAAPRAGTGTGANNSTAQGAPKESTP